MTTEDSETTLPVAERRPHHLTAHGDTRVDDWYWVRDRDDPAVMPLLEAENAYTAAATAHLDPLVDQVYREILGHTQLTDVSYPVPKGSWAYYSRTIEGADYSVFCRRPFDAPLPEPGDGKDDPHETVLLDENELARGHEYLEVGDRALTRDQRLLAYAADFTGSELMTIRIRDIETGRDLDDVIEGAYFLARRTSFRGFPRCSTCRRSFRPWKVAVCRTSFRISAGCVTGRRRLRGQSPRPW